jgi:hypothetical protein
VPVPEIAPSPAIAAATPAAQPPLPKLDPIDAKQAALQITLGGLPTSVPRTAASTKSNTGWTNSHERLARCRDLVRAHERATRARRRLRLGARDSTPLHALQDRLREIADLRCQTWLADESLCRDLSPEDLKRLERRYRALNASLGWTIDFFRDRPKVSPGNCGGEDLQHLHDRLAILAEAQCGVRTEFSELADRIPGIRDCKAQEETFYWLRESVRDDQFAIFLRFMSRSEHSPASRSFEIVEDIERHRLRQDRFDPVEAWKDAIAVDDAAEPEREDDSFDSVSDAVDAALRRFGGDGSALVFLPRAIESAESSTFRRPDQVFLALKALYDVASDWRTRTEGLGTSFRDQMRQLGFDERPCSDLTMKRHRKHYHASYGVREIPLSLHMTLGSRNANTCLSIHWCRDDLTRRVVVGHCGRHLPNTLS